jgi:hypothetical protein
MATEGTDASLERVRVGDRLREIKWGMYGRKGYSVAMDSLLGAYLNDHLAGSTTGIELIRRLARQHRGTPPGDTLQRIADEVAEDRRTMLRVLRALGVRPSRYKVYAGWAAEKVSRLMSNGRVPHSASLAVLLELETMRLGVQGKGAVWRVLRALADHESRLHAGQLDHLIERADRQADALEELRLQHATRIFLRHHARAWAGGGPHRLACRCQHCGRRPE